MIKSINLSKLDSPFKKYSLQKISYMRKKLCSFSKMSKSIIAIFLTAIIAISGTFTYSAKAIYDEQLGYDPEAQPCFSNVSSVETLKAEIERLGWDKVCKMCIGGFEGNGTLGIFLKNNSWIVYKCWDRTDYDTIRTCNDEQTACRVFLIALEQRARMRKPFDFSLWYPRIKILY